MLHDIQQLLSRSTVRYGSAVVAVAAALLCRQALVAYVGPGLPTYITFYPAVMVVALLVGFWPGVLATLLTALAAAYWLLPPEGFAVEALVDIVGLVLFSGMGLFMSAVAELYRRSRQEVAALEKEAALAETREALARERANLQAMFDVVNVGLLLIDDFGVVKRVNNTLSRWVGKNLADHESVQPGDFVGCIHALAEPAGCGHTPRCASCPIRNTFESTLRSGQPAHDVETAAILSLHGNEVRLWLHVSADPLLLDGKRHVLLAMNNVTERKRYEETLHQTAAELQRSNQELEQFAYVASHDLQEPLRQVRAFVQLLEKRYHDVLDGDAEQYMQFIIGGAARMSDLIQGLLAYSRVGSHREQQPTSCQESLDIALANLQTSIAESQAQITHDELPTIVAQPTQLVQLFQNLIGNAVKFRRSDVTPEVHVGARRDGAQWLFSVKDNGIGIAAKHYDRAFLIFQQLHGREKYAGTGLGLAICKKIVEQCGGRIWIESTVGQGSTFCFSLPDAKDAA